MKMRFSPTVFAAAFCVAYIGVFFFEWPLFRYYPIEKQWVWGAAVQPGHVGPAMAWYGLWARAAVIAVVAAIVVPDRWLMSFCRGWLWVWPVAVIGASCYLLRVFFI